MIWFCASSFHQVRALGEGNSYEKAAVTRHQVSLQLDLGLPASRTVRNEFLLFINHPISALL